MVQIICKMPQCMCIGGKKEGEVAVMTIPHLQAGWLSADLGLSLPGGLEETPPGIQCS